MQKSAIRDRLGGIIRLPDGEIDVVEGALLIAAESQKSFDVDHYLKLISELASKFESEFDATTTFGVSVSSLNDFIHREEGFTGNVKNYYDPENSYLNRVIDTRRGIPITLALVHIGIGRNLGLPVGGINFPGHFLVRYGRDKNLIIDPFSGRTLSKADCSNLLRQIAGGRIKLIPEHFDFASNKDILLRMLDNLKQIFWREKSWDQARACVERQILIKPAATEFMVQLGAVFEMQGKPALAQSTYISLLEACDDKKLRDLVSKRLLAIEPRSPTVH